MSDRCYAHASGTCMALQREELFKESLRWAQRQLKALVTEDEGGGSFIRGTGTELVGFSLGMARIEELLR